MVNWPVSQRPREKLLANGAGSLTDVELVAIFLRTGTHSKSVLVLADDLIRQWGGIRGLLETDYKSLSGCHGIGLAKFVQLQAALELGERYLYASLDRGDGLLDPSTTRRFLKSKLRGYDREVFACLFLDNQHRVISYEELFFGTIDGASVHPREVLKRVLHHNASAVIFAHNHPSGVAEPSQADRRITDRLKSALLLVDVRVLDHMIVGDADVMSFAEAGLI
ncbi:MAG: DNA repair protein RadC [Candidatus Azotimanducaceae bacterium]|jgi:DNA repair protein RadC